ncbi:virulence-associated E family protein [Nostoc sp. PA-18-2419]|uniref:virulence-associated E family protein n=1 Tax=Nostoc sp. PA-18-2419 TaxID=2575443 RepID=UPI001108F292|nr:virulence-associated E family protein [Nostoc sp. PA-18-2419]
MNNCSDNITLPVAEWTEDSEVSSIALPTLWVADAFKGMPLVQLFQVVEYSQATKEISGDRHYIIFEPGISEAVIRGIAWRIRAAGGDCYLYGINNQLENLVEDAVTARDLTIQIFEFAQDYENWSKRQDEQPLTVKDACEVARVALAVLKEPERSIELATLGQRCKQSSYSWSKLVGAFEQEFKKELSRRGKGNIERLEREIQSSVSSSLEEESPARSKSKQTLNLITAQWGHRLRFNTMTLKPELDGEPLDMDTLATRLIKEFDIDIGNEKAGQMVVYLAKQSSYSPVAEYLERVAYEHSSVDLGILDDIATRYFGSNEPLHNVFMRKHLIGQVKRVFEPGCQHDTALVLQGGQGLQKSKFWRTLAVSRDWFDDTITSGTNDKDERLKLRRFWILELAELESVFKRKEIAGLRAFFTTPADNLRVPYGRSIEYFPRTSCFVGSVNPAQFLVDPEGHRRYWIIPVSVDQIPVDQLQKERDLLWAAAVIAYRNGEMNWLTKTEEKRNALLNKRHEVEDTWEEAIDAFLEFQSETTVSDILSNCLKIEVAKHDRVLQMRVAECLKRIGWVKCEKKKIDGKSKPVWRCQPVLAEVSTEVSTEGENPSNLDTPTNSTDIINQLSSKVSTKVSTASNPDIASNTALRLTPLLLFEAISNNQNDQVDNSKNVSRGVNRVNMQTPTQLPQGLESVDTLLDTFVVGDEVEYTGAERKSLHGKKLVVSEVEGDFFWLKHSGYIFPVVRATAAELRRR